MTKRCGRGQGGTLQCSYCDDHSGGPESQNDDTSDAADERSFGEKQRGEPAQ
jgi:hypothetical protein